MNIKFVKTAGLVHFIIGFAIFNFSFFWSSYRLTPAIVKNLISDERKANSLMEESSTLLDVEVSSNFRFVAALTSAIDRVNEKQLASFGFSDQEVDQLASFNKDKFQLVSVDSLFKGDDERNVFKRKAFRDYGSWLDGQPASREQIQGVADNIKKYGIVSQYGFDRYATKDLKYSLTKASASGPVKSNSLFYLLLTFGLCIAGALLYILPKMTLQPGIKNNGIFFNAMKNVFYNGIEYSICTRISFWIISFSLILDFK